MKFGTLASVAAAASLLAAPAFAQSMGGATSNAPSPSAQGTTGMTTGDRQAQQGRSMTRDGAAGGMARGTGMGGGNMGRGNMGGHAGTANSRNGY